MPELTELLEQAAVSSRPGVVPPYEVVERRVRRRRRRTAGVSVLSAVVAVSVLAGGVGVLRGTDTVRGGGTVAADPLAGLPDGSYLEPRPYAVSTTPPDAPRVPFQSTELGTVGDAETSAAWQLIGVQDSGLLIRYVPGCDGKGGVRVRERPDQVVIQIVNPRAPVCALPKEAVVTLEEPLGDRALVHVALGTREGVVDLPPLPPVLAAYFTDTPAYPGRPWSKEGVAVPTSELSLAAGPEHCNWERARFLGWTLLYSRDPEGVLTHSPGSQAGFRAGAVLPPDAAATGYTQGPVELWTAPSDRGEFVYLVNSADRNDAERWVRGGGGCL